MIVCKGLRQKSPKIDKTQIGMWFNEREVRHGYVLLCLFPIFTSVPGALRAEAGGFGGQRRRTYPAVAG